MKICEITETIHGEAPTPGVPCMLIRFSGCDIKCPYCDTPHDKFFEYSLDEVVKRVNESRLQSILITGGEPFIQPELEEFVRKTAKDKKIILETNGNALISNDNFFSYGNVTIVMDVKLFDKLKYFNPMNLTKLTTGDVIKFVFWDFDSFQLALEVMTNKQSILPWGIKWVFSPTEELIKKGGMQHYVDAVIMLQKTYPRQDIMFQMQIHKILGVK